MLKRLPYLLLAGVSLLYAQLAQADDDAKPAAADNEALFKQLDKNSDGQVAEDEIPQEKRRLFRRLLRTGDKDGNGKLSREEFVEGLKGTASEQPRGEAGRCAATGRGESRGVQSGGPVPSHGSERRR